MKKIPHSLISTNEVAELIGKDPRTVQRMAASGDLPAVKMPGKRGAFIFDRDAVIATISPASPTARPVDATPGSAGRALSFGDKK